MKPLKKSACPNCGYVKPKKIKNEELNNEKYYNYYKRHEKYYNYCKRHEELNDEKILKNNNNIE
jgi:hypothetical protein